MRQKLAAIGDVFEDSRGTYPGQFRVTAIRKIQPGDSWRLNQVSLNTGRILIMEIGSWEEATRNEYILERMVEKEEVKECIEI